MRVLWGRFRRWLCDHHPPCPPFARGGTRSAGDGRLPFASTAARSVAASFGWSGVRSIENRRLQRAVVASGRYERSSTGRAPVSKTGGWGFDSLRSCCRKAAWRGSKAARRTSGVMPGREFLMRANEIASAGLCQND